jgi:hypothetical protein
VFEGLTFHLLRHTAASLMARGMDPAAAAERLGHSEGGALFLRRYRHLYEAEKRLQVARLESFVREHFDTAWTDDADEPEGTLSQVAAERVGAPGIEPGTSRV